MSYRSASDRYGLTKLYPPIQFVDNGKQIVFESEHMISQGSLYPAGEFHWRPTCCVDSDGNVHLSFGRSVGHGAGGGDRAYMKITVNGINDFTIPVARDILPELTPIGYVNRVGPHKIFQTTDGAIAVVCNHNHETENRREFFCSKSFNGGDSFERVNPANLFTTYYYDIQGPCKPVLQNGYWIAPAYGSRVEGSGRQGDAFISPAADGMNWTRIGTIAQIGAANYEENGIVPRADKLLVGLTRTDELEGLHVNFSPNGGRNWSLPQAKGIPLISTPDFCITDNGTIFGYGRYSLDGGSDDSPSPDPTGPNYWRTIKVWSTDGAGSFDWDWADNRQYAPPITYGNQNAICIWHPGIQRILAFYGVNYGNTAYQEPSDVIMHVLREEDV